MADSEKPPIDLGYAREPERKPKWIIFSSKWVLLWLAPPAIAFVISLVLPFIERLHPGTVSRALCDSNLRAIADACATYAAVNDGRSPPNLDRLVNGGDNALLEPDELMCPSADRVYRYIPGQTRSDDLGNVLVYEPLGNHDREGGFALFLDGGVKWLSPEEHKAAIARTMANLRARTVTQPASSASQPCR